MENLYEKLDSMLLLKYMKDSINFIVMNEKTAKDMMEVWKNPFEDSKDLPIFTTYRGHEVLLSETLKDGEFRIG